MTGLYEFGVAEFNEPPCFLGGGGGLSPSHLEYSTNSISIIPVYNANVDIAPTPPVIKPTSINGLFGWWEFFNGGYDSTNLLHSATIVGGNASGGFLNLDGTNGFASISDDPFDTSLTSFSIVARIKASVLDGNDRNILSKRNNSSYRGWSLYLGGNTNKIVIEASDTGTMPFYKLSSTNPVNVGVEYHVAAVFDRILNKIYLYINGVGQGSVDITGMGSLNNTIILNFGNETGENKWEGSLRDIRFYKKSLSSSDVSNLSNGINLYGDIPVFGTFLVPTYIGTTNLSKHPSFEGVAIRTLPRVGQLSVSSHPILSSLGVNSYEVFIYNMVSYFVTHSENVMYCVTHSENVMYLVTKEEGVYYMEDYVGNNNL